MIKRWNIVLLQRVEEGRWDYPSTSYQRKSWRWTRTQTLIYGSAKYSFILHSHYKDSLTIETVITLRDIIQMSKLLSKHPHCSHSRLNAIDRWALSTRMPNDYFDRGLSEMIKLINYRFLGWKVDRLQNLIWDFGRPRSFYSWIGYSPNDWDIVATLWLTDLDEFLSVEPHFSWRFTKEKIYVDDIIFKQLRGKMHEHLKL